MKQRIKDKKHSRYPAICKINIGRITPNFFTSPQIAEFPPIPLNKKANLFIVFRLKYFGSIDPNCRSESSKACSSRGRPPCGSGSIRPPQSSNQLT